ncbi:MAG TPA: hypothetical protein VLG76_08015 [Rhabdochlamydiaceae bacterium]|nr:hypothetical protein [Rhabdochlamydiaceae bacterium]
MLALNSISWIPGAAAKNSQQSQTNVCKKLCEPLPGDENDAPERICTETCEKGAEVIEKTTKEKLENGTWKVMFTKIEPVTKIMDLVFDCPSLCNEGIAAAANIGKKYIDDALQYGWKMASGKAAIRGICVLPSQAGKLGGGAYEVGGKGLCMACCTGGKWFKAI